MDLHTAPVHHVQHRLIDIDRYLNELARTKTWRLF